MSEQELVGKTIAEVEIDGFGIEMIMVDGTALVYSASDGGYSSWDVYKDTERSRR